MFKFPFTTIGETRFTGAAGRVRLFTGATTGTDGIDKGVTDGIFKEGTAVEGMVIVFQALAIV